MKILIVIIIWNTFALLGIHLFEKNTKHQGPFITMLYLIIWPIIYLTRFFQFINIKLNKLFNV